MGFKKMDRNLSFAEYSLMGTIEKNQAVERLDKINSLINWERVEEIITAGYPVGKEDEGNNAYPPLLLFKYLLLGQWYGIRSDQELETQINDRVSFRRFLGLSFHEAAPDHSTFARFRSRLGKDLMRRINSELINQIAAFGFSLSSGVAVDARLVKSASKPMSKEKLQEERERRTTPEGKLDRNGKVRKFSRDLNSDWTIRDGGPHFCFKEHACVETNHGFLMATEITPASHLDSPYLTFCVAESMHTQEPIKIVYADKGYHGKENRDFLHLNGIEDGIMRKDTRGGRLTPAERERNMIIARFRYLVEQYFGISHLHHAASQTRFTMIVINAIDAMFRQFVFNVIKVMRLAVS